MSFSQLAIQRALTEIPILPNGCAAISPSSVMRVKTMNTSEWFIFFVSALLTVTTILNYYAISYFTSINKNFGRDMPYRREQINSIIVVPPTAAVCALLTMLAPRLNIYLDFARVVVFGMSIGSLFNLILDYFGGLTNLTRVMKDKQWTLTTGPICCVCPCLPTKKTNKDWFRNLWWGAYQPPVMNCLMTLFTALMIVEGIWTADNPQIAAVLVKLCSTGFGVYCLTVISENVKETLHMFNVGAKFMNFKLCLLFINIQPIVIAFCPFDCVYPYTNAGRGTYMHNQLLVLEMFLVAALQRKIFIYDFCETEKLPEDKIDPSHMLPPSSKLLDGIAGVVKNASKAVSQLSSRMPSRRASRIYEDDPRESRNQNQLHLP